MVIHDMMGVLGDLLNQVRKVLENFGWNKEELMYLAFRKKSLLTELLGLDAKEELLGLSHEEQSRRTEVKGDIEILATLEETFWTQKFCALYVEGEITTHASFID